MQVTKEESEQKVKGGMASDILNSMDLNHQPHTTIPEYNKSLAEAGGYKPIAPKIIGQNNPYRLSHN